MIDFIKHKWRKYRNRYRFQRLIDKWWKEYYVNPSKNEKWIKQGERGPMPSDEEMTKLMEMIYGAHGAYTDYPHHKKRSHRND